MARILVVDDEAAISELIKAVLVMQGHECETAANAPEALQILKKAPCQLIIIDRNMPMMSGVQLVTLLRSNRQFDRAKIIMCTSSSTTKDVDEAYSAGANDYLLKPVDMRTLIAKVQKVLGAVPK